jgi:hypothetical protein
MTTASVEHRAAGAAFRYPDFCLFQTARFLMVSGLEMQSVAVDRLTAESLAITAEQDLTETQ